MMNIQPGIASDQYDTCNGSDYFTCKLFNCELANESSLQSKGRDLIEKLDPSNACSHYELYPTKYAADYSKIIIFAKEGLEAIKKPAYYKRLSVDYCYEVTVENIDTDEARQFLANCTERAIPTFINKNNGKPLYIHPCKIIDLNEDDRPQCPSNTSVQSMVPKDCKSNRMFWVLEPDSEWQNSK